MFHLSMKSIGMTRRAIFFKGLGGSLLGLISFVVPNIETIKHARVVDIYYKTMDHLNIFETLLYFFISGVVIGLIERKDWLLISSFTIYFIALLLGIDFVLHNNRHNLMPFELAIIFIFAFCAVLGSAVCRFLIWTTLGVINVVAKRIKNE